MSRQVLTYGTLSGVIIIGTTLLRLALGSGESSMAAAEWVGYLVMIVALSMIFVGIKRYRDQELGGVIRFGTAFKVGLGISLVASIIYVVGWEANLALTDHAFIDDYTQSVIAQKEAAGLTGDELAAEVARLEDMKVSYGKVQYRLPMTFMEIFPVGLLITLLSAALLRNRGVLSGGG